MRGDGVSPYRDLIVGTETPVRLANGRMTMAINFDNAATTPPLQSVLAAICRYAPWYSSVHRGKGHKSVFSSDLYEKSREAVRRFVHADRDHVVMYTKSTTEAINLAAHILREDEVHPVILSTEMEHLANDLPWRPYYRVQYVSTDASGRLDMADLQECLNHLAGRVKLVTVTGASNVTGYKNDIHGIARLAHCHGAKILVDGAQLIPHALFDMSPADPAARIDYLAFSAHKMYAPFGTGILIAPGRDIKMAEPLLHGGGAVDLASHQFVRWLKPPELFEAGTPNMMGVVALLAGMETLADIGIGEVHEYETRLIRYAISGLQSIPGVVLYSCDDNICGRVSLISFTVEGLSHHTVAEILAREGGIAVRSGLFCAHPYVEKLLGFTERQMAYYQQHEDVTMPGLVRISFGLYNNFREIDIFLALLEKIARHVTRYRAMYAEGENRGATRTFFDNGNC